jgi:hypothetical protein
MPGFECSFDGGQEFSDVDRFHDVGIRAPAQALDRGLHVGGARQHDHGHVGVDGANLTEELDPGHARHLEFGQDERRPPGLEDLQPLVPVAGQLAVVAGAEKDLVQNLATWRSAATIRTSHSATVGPPSPRVPFYHPSLTALTLHCWNVSDPRHKYFLEPITWGSGSSSKPPRRPLRRVPRRALPSGAGRARDRVLHGGRVERRAPAALGVARELRSKPWRAMPTATRPIPDLESSQTRSGPTDHRIHPFMCRAAF